MLRTTLRNLAANKLRLLTTGFAVLLGVAFMSGTMILSATMDKTFDDMFVNAYDGTDGMVRSSSVLETPEGLEIRPRIDESMVQTIEAVDGVAVAQAEVWGTAQVIDRAGEPVGNPEMGPPTLGATWPVDELNTWTLVEGRGPEADDEVVIDKKTADDAEYAAGDQARILVNGAPLDVTVTGVVRLADTDSPGGAQFSIFTVEGAQKHFGEAGKVDSIAIAAEDGVSQAELVRRVSGVLGDDVEAITGEAFVQENQDAMAEATAFFDQFMLIFAVVALLVGGFTIFNTFFITVAQRTKQHALMRAIGASRRQVLWFDPARGRGHRDHRLGHRARRGPADRRGAEGDADGVRRGAPCRRDGLRARHGGRRVQRRPHRHRGVGRLPGPQGRQGPADRRDARHRGQQQRLRLQGAGHGGRGRPRRRCRRTALRAVRLAVERAGDRRWLGDRGVLRGLGAGPERVPADEPLHRLAAGQGSRHRRAPRSPERDAEPEAHGGDRRRADDRRRPGGVHHDLRGLHEGVVQRHPRPCLHR
jgi:ABC-type lipoprotein release transport system permease subunit